MKPADESPKLNPKAAAALQRTIESRQKLPLSETAGGPARVGVMRMRGAFLIELGRIRPDPKQPRRDIDAQELENLTASVRERGIKQPIRVCFIHSEDVYQIISGERRYQAAKAAGLPTMPCIIEDAPAGQVPPRREVLVDQIVENWQREDLNPYDLSDALKELRDEHGLTQETIAKVTGKPKSEISRFLAMQRVSAGVQAVVREDQEGRFSRRHVVALSQVSEHEQAGLAQRIKDEKLSAVETERIVERMRRKTTGGQVRGAPTTMRRFSVGTTQVKIVFRKKSVTRDDVLDVLTRVREMVQREDEGE